MSVNFSGEMAALQQAAARTEDYAARRTATISALQPRHGEHILDLGCGGGVLLREIAAAIGPGGKAFGIDVSIEQGQAAREHCASASNTQIVVGSILELPYEDQMFDAAVSMQVLEYVEDVPSALRQVARVMKTGGRFINFATNWGSLFYSSTDAARTRRILDAFDAHAPHPNLPARLRADLNENGFGNVQQSPMTILNCGFQSNLYSYILAHIIAKYVINKDLVSQEEAGSWITELTERDKANRYMFCSTAIITRANKVS